MADGFLGRWSRRKQDAREGRPLPPEAPVQPVPAAPAGRLPGAAGGPGGAAPPAPDVASTRPATPPEPPPTLEDVRALAPDGDFSRFVRADVPADVKNAAVRKLFSDPHFNVMDGLDVYVDDYTKPDPIPESMLRTLTSGQFLGLFREEPGTDEPAAQAREHAEAAPGASVAQSQPAVAASPAAAPTEVPSHADPDLRLQQDHAPGPGEAGRGAG